MLDQLAHEEIETVLANNLVGHLGCHADGTTYVVPISYAYDGRNVIAHSTEGMKLEIMRKNPNVCFQVDEMNNMANWKSVITWGRFEEIADPSERADALTYLLQRNLPLVSSITTHLGNNWPFSVDLEKIEGIVYRIVLNKKTGRFEKAEESPHFAG